jgi:hypothetical protein
MVPPSLHRVPRVVPLLHRYYETLRLPDSRFASLRFLRSAIPRTVCVSSPCGPRRQTHGSSWSLLCRLLLVRPSSKNCQDLPSSRGTLLTIRLALRPRWDRIRERGPIVNGSDAAPAYEDNGGSPRVVFRGSITRPLVSLSTPRSGSCPPPRQTRFRLLVPVLPDGIRTRRAPYERFHIILMLPPFRVPWRNFVIFVHFCSSLVCTGQNEPGHSINESELVEIQQ